MLKTVEFTVSAEQDRRNLISILAMAGYKVWQRKEGSYSFGNEKYIVCVEYFDAEVESK